MPISFPAWAMQATVFSAQSKKDHSKAGGTMLNKEGYIAVFDSGIGGISVLRELIKQMPQERYLYYGDSANAPYGKRTTEEVRQLTMAAAEKLMQRNIKALVVACNTATSAAITQLRSAYPDMIVVGIEPALKMAADRFPGGRIGVMATPVTLREEKFLQQVERFSQVQTEAISVPMLAEWIEAGHRDGAETEELLKPILQPYENKLDAVVLGCTHYPFVAKTISKLLGSKTVVLDGGEGTARETHRRLEEAGLLWDGPGSVCMENSADNPRFLAYGMELLEEAE